MNERLHVLISGRVQGVYYRAFTAEAARRNQVTGWVRNLSDGRVEAVLEGDMKRLEQLIDELKAGPPNAIVKDIDIQREAYTGEYKYFHVRY